MSKLKKLTIIEHIELTTDVYKMTVEGMDEESKPGQFINISTGDNSLLLRRPISIHEVDGDKLSIIYRVEGDGTRLISEMKVGEKLDILAPLGNGFPMTDKESVILVGGGIGVPPLYELAKHLQVQGKQIITVLGFQNKEASFSVEDFKQFGDVYVATVDGDLGTKGFVTDVIKNEELNFETLYACGPTAMLKALDEEYNGNVEGYLSFEERMACGIGACFACVCKANNAKKGYVRVCYEGPVFELGRVIYE
jgi:dihydroorotate dehydrogenase electron transfer subunit